VDKFPMSAPDDMSGLEKLFHSGLVVARDVIGVVAKTEGNGRVNDFSRPLALRCFKTAIGKHAQWSARDLDAHVSFVMSGGCEGVIAPHAVVFSRRLITGKSRAPAGKRFAAARAR